MKHAVERLLDGVDAVIYVLDFTKLKTSSEVCACLGASLRRLLQLRQARCWPHVFYSILGC